MTKMRGIRGAARISENTREAILCGTQELLAAMMTANGLATEQIAAVCFTLTVDLNGEFPAYAARQLGWRDVPLLCAQEIAVPGAMSRVLRVLMLVNTDKSQDAIQHQYLGEAAVLRPDLSETVPS